MSEMVNEMENVLKDAGMDISDGTPFDNAPQTTEPIADSVVEPQAVVEEQIPQQEEYQLEQEQSSFEDQQIDIEAMVSDYLSETLGIGDIAEIQSRLNTPSSLDERVEKIAQFVADTGRSPEEWFQYQQLNPTEMDDLTAIKMETMTQYPDLTAQQVNKLVQSRYKLDDSLYDENDIELSKIQLQIDAKNARQGIEELRSSYMLPQSQVDSEQLFDDAWIGNMRSTVNDIDGISFDLPNGQEFTYGLDGGYKSELIGKNEALETYFDQYIDEQGNWDVETLSIHRAVVDNMESIVSAIYQQGLSDGQRNVVGKAANAQVGTPGVNPNSTEDPLTEQLRNALGRGSDNLMKFL